MVITEYSMSHIDTMEGHEFERFIATLLRQLGFQKVEVTRGSGDQGVDVLAEKDDIRYAVQCKCYSTDLGNTPVQEVNTGKMVYQCHVGVVITNRYFTQSAKEAAKATGVLLWDRTKLEKMIAQVQEASNVERLAQQGEESIVSWNGSPLLKRGAIALKDREWKKAIQFFDRVLNIDPENAEAYLGIAMAESELSDIDEFMQSYRNDPYVLYGKNLNHAKEFARSELSAWFDKEDKLIQEKEDKEQEKQKQEQEEQEKRRKETIIRLSSVRESIKKLMTPIVTGSYDHCVGIKADGAVVFASNHDNGKYDVSNWRDIVSIVCGSNHIVGLKADGTVVSVGNNAYGQCNVSDWRNIVAVACEACHTVGLKIDGTVVAVGNNDVEQCNVTGWRNIVSVVCGDNHTIGVKADGTVISTDKEYNDEISEWRDIVTVVCGKRKLGLNNSKACIVGLKANGTVVATGEYNVSEWRNIAVVSCGSTRIVGVEADGTVVIAEKGNTPYKWGRNFVIGTASELREMREWEKSKWKNMVTIEVTQRDEVVGLNPDGTIEALEWDSDVCYGVDGWGDIVDIVVNDDTIIGIKSDGSVLWNGEALQWNLLDDLDVLAQRQFQAKNQIKEIIEEEKRRIEEKRHQIEIEQESLRTELASLKGLFTGKRRREIEARLREISMDWI